MNKGTHFNGQPKTAGSLMAQPPADYRLHDNKPFFQPHIQGQGRHPKTRKKKGGIKVHTNIHACLTR